MTKTINANDLKIGMYIIIPRSWFNHPFLKKNFVIESREQINKIIESGIKEVHVDPAKGLPVDDLDYVSHGEKLMPVAPPEKWEPEKLIPDELKEAIYDKSLPPGLRATTVYKYSVVLMKRMFDDPKAENIKAVKSVICDIVDTIISDNATAENMLMITSHDFYTYTHSVNVGVLSIILSKALFQSSDAHNMHELGAGFFLHDLGKVRVNPAIINKPGKLTDEEMMKMRIHPYQSYKILAESGQLTEECRVIAMQHHEREDGTGYPRRLKGDEIHQYGRICCIADVYDALTATRSYKPKLSPFQALKIMKEEMIDHFHRDIFDKFVHVLS
jgi:HD-GYP domain-containing protein (c-di-GMP phosphodiesterase class II)